MFGIIPRRKEKRVERFWPYEPPMELLRREFAPLFERMFGRWPAFAEELKRASGVDVDMHDLRRTARTLMSRLGVVEDIAELAIGHQRVDLVGRYNKDQAWPARVEAFGKVSAHISTLLAKAADDLGNVIAMHGAARAFGE